MSSPVDNSGTEVVSAVGAVAPLSYEQEGIWLGSQFAAAPADFHNFSALRLEGALDIPRLEGALTAVAARHDILRTIFDTDTSQPGQRVVAPSPVRLPIIDPPAGDARIWQTEAFRAFAFQLCAPPFALSAAPPWRAHLIRLAENDHVLLTVFHHIVIDGRSSEIFDREVAAFYNGRHGELPALPVRYAQYAAAHRERAGQIARDIEEWRAHLEATTRAIAFPAPAHGASAHRAQHRFVIDGALVAQIERLARQRGASTFGALSAALGVTLSRVSGDVRLAVNVIKSTRHRPEVDQLIGVLVDAMPLRIDLSPVPTFLELVERVRDSLRWGYARPVPAFALARALGGTPEARSGEVAINFHKVSTRAAALEGLRASLWRHAGGHSAFALALEVYTDDGSLDCLIDYDTTRVSVATIERIADGLQAFLRAATYAPDAPIHELPTISPTARAARLAVQPRGHVTTAHNATVPELFAQQVLSNAGRLAISDDRGEWSIGAVDERANRLAHLLLSRGVKPGAHVGVCLQRSADFVIAALAAMKAGAAYVPIDPAYPPERIRLISDIAAPACVISREELRDRLPSGAALLLLDHEADQLAAQPALAPALTVTPDAPAYVLFTSGSTGRPRGVIGRHRGIANRIAWMRRTYPFWNDEVCAQKTSVGFVDSVWEIFGPLTSGIPLVIVPDGVVADARGLVETLAQHHVTRIVLVPSLLEAVLDSGADLDAALHRLRLCICSGEPLPPSLAARCRARLPHVTLLNIYGSSEVSADVTWCEITSQSIGDIVSIGRPIDNVTIYLLDRAQQLVPPGDEGELYVSGAAVAAGYFGDDAATGERFLPDPYSTAAGARMFKTGDRGRLRPDGELELLGRLDHQIKLLGRRIEPGEVESALTSHPSIRQAAVVLHRERAMLAAFVVPRSPDGIDSSTLNEFLRGRLPHYMVPAAIITTDSLPLSPHGKIDRAALQSRDLAGHGPQDTSRVLTSDLEQRVATLWTEVLGITPRSPDDDFIALGGHSLRATRLAWRARETFGVTISPGAVFAHSTVRAFAAELARIIGSQQAGVPPILPGEHETKRGPSAVQRQFWLEEQLQDARGANHHGRIYRVRGPFDLGAFDRSVTTLLVRHEALRTISLVENGDLVMSLRAPEPHISTVEDLTGVAEGDRDSYVDARLQAERRRPFALDRELPFRVRIYRLAADHHVISFSAHHSAFDGWSAAILMRELSAIYAAERRGAQADLDPPPIKYADFAAWQRACRDSPALARQREFWRLQLAGAPSAIDLPADRSPRAGLPPRMDRVAVTLDAALLARLRALGQREGATTFMTLLAGYGALLGRYSGQWDLVIGTVSANRHLPSTQSVIGAFVNTLALRLTLDADGSFANAVRVARTVTATAFDHTDLPFDLVVAEAARRGTAQTPLFQAMFAMQDQEGWTLDLDGLETTAIDAPPGLSAIPLSLVLHDDGERVEGHFEYRADVFDAATIRRLSANYVALLTHAAASSDTPLHTLPVISEQEAGMLRAFEGTVAPERRWERLERVFARHADRTPDAPALAIRGQEYSYRDIDQRAQQVAARLIALGVSPGEFVAIQVPRSPALYIAMLGVLNACAAYVVIDPSQPDERRRFIIQDSGAVVLVTAGDDGEDGVVLTSLQPEHPEPAGDARTADAVACLVYTSGSSGNPKGVRITHRNIGAMSDAFGGMQRMRATSRVAQMVSPAFDVALNDVFGPWSRGACICALDPAESMPGKTMIAALARMGVTHWTIPPTLLAECPVKPWPELEVISIGGEPASKDVLSPWNTVRIVNAYGLTEGTVASTAEDYDPALPPSVGFPLPGVQLRIVDARGERLPIGAPGEIELAGPQVADGYHRRPEFSAQRFHGAPRARRLRTGDRGRWLADGRVEFFGRIDRQIKFHGYRIEPAEIEAAARSHPAIDQAFVIVRGGDNGDRLVAYVVPRIGHAATGDQLRAHLRDRLPPTMCPTDVVFVDAFPRTTTGKVDARALPEPARPGTTAHAGVAGRTEEIIAGVWREVLGHSQFGRDQSFFDAGGHSLLLVRAHERLATHFGDQLGVVDLFAHPTVASLARYLDGRVPQHAEMDAAPAKQRRIAIVGMACRYPQSPSPDALWRNLVDGVECLTRFTPEELTAAGVDAAAQSDPRFVPVAGVVDGIDQFDADFFGLSAAEARLVDPQQRMLLELSQRALEAAGYDPRRYAGRIGVFAGVGFNGYLRDVLYPTGIPSTAEGFAAISANDKDFAASQVAYRLDLRGPAVTVQTACSTSLVAVDVAIQALLAGRCEMALAGGVSLRVPTASGYRHEDGMILSPDGHCRPFDASAAGTVGSSGGGVVVLKPLEAAIADGDRIEAVIIGSASNNDGRGKVGFTAPGVEGQAAVIRAALEQSGADPASIHYIEAHGTGTSLGDPIEIQALNDTYGRAGDAPLAIGSIKSNLGHTDTAAGVAGLIKAALSVKHDRIPPTLHFATPNPRIAFGRLFVADRVQPFPAGTRRAAVSAFGIGGTNAHVIVEQPPVGDAPRAEIATPHILPVSALSEAALQDTCADLAHALDDSTASLEDIAFTLQRGRRDFAHRHAVVAASVSEARAAFLTRARGSGAWPPAGDGRSAWLFTGQGSQRPAMARALYDAEPVARAWLDRCAEMALPHLGLDLRAMLCGDDPAVHETRYAQPALFALQIALARTWQAYGLTPSALIGHSIGEFAAACIGGIFDLDDAMFLVCERGRLMHQCRPGAMLSVRITEAALRPLIDGDPVDIAAINAPDSCVVAGSAESIARVGEKLSVAGYTSRPLVTARAFHSHLMTAAEEPFARAVDRVKRGAPAIPIVSTLTGEWMTPEEAIDPARWRRQLREPVRFLDAIRTLEADAAYALLEIGPDQTLATLVRQIVTDDRRCAAASLPAFDAAVGRMWAAGCPVDWSAAGAERGRRVQLPGYPFERRSHWGGTRQEPRADRRERPLDDWFSIPTWSRRPLAAAKPRADATWLIITAGGDHDATIEREIERRGGKVRSTRLDEGAIAEIRATRPAHIVFRTRRSPGDLNQALSESLHGLLDVVRVTGEHADAVDLTLVTEDVLDVTGLEGLDAAQAPAIGALRIVPYEYPAIRCRHIDVSAGADISSLADELCGASPEPTVALRGRQRFVPSWSPVTLTQGGQVFREGGTYLITGGFGGVGLTIARHLGEAFRATVALVGRSGVPSGERWIEAREAIERAGGAVLPYAADAGDPAAMRAVVEDIRRRRGVIHGCVHAAGTIDRGGVIHRRSRESMDAAIHAKVHGAANLLDLLASEPLDFLILCSTLGSMLPQSKFAQAGYSAANEYLDAFAAAARRRGVPATTINWDDWSDVGMTVVAGIDAAAEGRPHLQGRAIAPSEGIEVLSRIAGTPYSQVVVSTTPLDIVRKDIARLFAGPAADRETPLSMADPATALAGLWSDALGVEALTADSNFFMLGGHSLMAIQILTNVREMFDVTLPLAGFLDQPTLGRQTLALERALARRTIASVDTAAADTDEDFTL